MDVNCLRDVSFFRQAGTKPEPLSVHLEFVFRRCCFIPLGNRLLMGEAMVWWRLLSSVCLPASQQAYLGRIFTIVENETFPCKRNTHLFFLNMYIVDMSCAVQLKQHMKLKKKRTLLMFFFCFWPTPLFSFIRKIGSQWHLFAKRIRTSSCLKRGFGVHQSTYHVQN